MFINFGVGYGGKIQRNSVTEQGNTESFLKQVSWEMRWISIVEGKKRNVSG